MLSERTQDKAFSSLLMEANGDWWIVSHPTGKSIYQILDFNCVRNYFCNSANSSARNWLWDFVSEILAEYDKIRKYTRGFATVREEYRPRGPRGPVERGLPPVRAQPAHLQGSVSLGCSDSIKSSQKPTHSLAWRPTQWESSGPCGHFSGSE